MKDLILILGMLLWKDFFIIEREQVLRLWFLCTSTCNLIEIFFEEMDRYHIMPLTEVVF